MDIKGKYGSKQRLFEMMQGVNKTKINESAWQERLNNTVNIAFDKLKTGALKIDQGGSNRAVMQSVDDTSYIIIDGHDNEGNSYSFTFKIQATEGDQEGVGYINDVILEKFSYRNTEGQRVFDVNKDDLSEFNKQHGSELYDAIEKYIEGDSQAGEELDEVNKKEESDPYGGSNQDYQDHMGYGDEKPVNSKLRTKAPELEKFVKEEDIENQDQVPAMDTQDVDNDGDKLEGGLGDESDVEDFDPDQIIKGIEVEMEHTKDPQLALEITMDHLRELPDYYTRLSKMEKQGEKDHKSTNDNETDELADTLLGYEIQTPNTLPEDYDYAGQEREYEDREEYRRFKELDSKPFDSLTDEETEEYFKLWQDYGDM